MLTKLVLAAMCEKLPFPYPPCSHTRVMFRQSIPEWTINTFCLYWLDSLVWIITFAVAFGFWRGHMAVWIFLKIWKIHIFPPKSVFLEKSVWTPKIRTCPDKSVHLVTLVLSLTRSPDTTQPNRWDSTIIVSHCRDFRLATCIIWGSPLIFSFPPACFALSLVPFLLKHSVYS